VSTRVLESQIAIVTGANAGIGRACAIDLAQAGASVVVNHRPNEKSKAAADELVALIGESGGQALSIAADVSDEAQVQALFDQTIDRFGRIDTLVSNAGIEKPSAIQDMSLADWQAVIDVNLTGQFLCARQAVRHFLARQPHHSGKTALGRIIMMSSVHEVIPWAFQNNYAASKGGIAMFMRSLAQEVAPSRIRVNAVAPGAIKTKINQASWEDPKKREEMLKLIPYGRIGEPEDVARAVTWLASDASDYVTGTTLFVDGGMTLYPEFRGNG